MFRIIAEFGDWLIEKWWHAPVAMLAFIGAFFIALLIIGIIVEIIDRNRYQDVPSYMHYYDKNGKRH